MLKNEEIQHLKKVANQIRIDLIDMISYAQSGHPGGALSAVEIVTSLYFRVMNIKPSDPKWEDRDRFILSKGHACAVLYASLAEKGYFPKETLKTFRKFQSILQGHPDMRKTPGVEMNSGTLGNGISAGVGMSLGAKLSNKNLRVYVLLGCGELNEGVVWESAMAASHFKLDNMTAIVDFNKLQSDGEMEKIMNMNPLSAKWQAFGWHTIEVNGHNFEELILAFEEAKKIKGKPTAIIAHTIKGKGVSYMENKPQYHGTYKMSSEETRIALEDLTKERTVI
ncbi:MAG: transketolase [Candidatus Firestonebacteria bacterium]